MKLLIAICFSFLTVGCTNRVILSTHYPHTKEYDLSFGWMLVNEVKGSKLTQEEREEKYKTIIDRLLGEHEATATCSVVANSFQYYEPGCCASAKVICKEEVTFGEPEKIYNSDGVPLFSYKLRNE